MRRITQLTAQKIKSKREKKVIRESRQKSNIYEVTNLDFSRKTFLVHCAPCRQRKLKFFYLFAHKDELIRRGEWWSNKKRKMMEEEEEDSDLALVRIESTYSLHRARVLRHYQNTENYSNNSLNSQIMLWNFYKNLSSCRDFNLDHRLRTIYN